MRVSPILALVVAAALAPLSAGGQTNADVPSRWIFLSPDVDFGSRTLFSPANVVVSRGLSTLVWTNSERRLPEIEWRGGLASLWDALSNPSAAVERAGGWAVWLEREAMPGDNVLQWAFAANFAGHVVAGGITYRHLREWFEHHGAPAPRLLAVGTIWGSILLNETVEAANSHPFGPGPASSVADFYIWEPLGMLLFEIDPVARLFAETLSAADWSPQGALVFPELRVENAAQLMSYKVDLPFLEDWRPMVLIGQGNLWGLQWRGRRPYEIGGAVGFAASARHVEEGTAYESITATWAAGAFVSRDDSLLGSVVFTRASRVAVQANLYPGVLPGAFRNLGVWTSVTRSGAFSLGIAMRATGGVGLGLHTPGVD